MASNMQTLSNWLKDAYAMEKSLVVILEDHAKDAEGHPDVQDKIREHLEQTKNHAEVVASCVQKINGDVSKVKAGMGQISGVFQNIASSVAADEIVKNGIADYAAENFEIASYNGIITAAEEVNETEIADACRGILDQEINMANYLAELLPVITLDYLNKQT